MFADVSGGRAGAAAAENLIVEAGRADDTQTRSDVTGEEAACCVSGSGESREAGQRGGEQTQVSRKYTDFQCFI